MDAESECIKIGSSDVEDSGEQLETIEISSSSIESEDESENYSEIDNRQPQIFRQLGKLLSKHRPNVIVGGTEDPMFLPCLTVLPPSFSVQRDATSRKRAYPQSAIKVSLPITEETFKSLSMIATKTPVVMDDCMSVDKVPQDFEGDQSCLLINGDQLHFGNQMWNDMVEERVAYVKDKINVNATTVEAKLCHLLLEGEHIDWHRSNSKDTGVFGTLAFILPSEYEGGAFKGRLSGKERKYGENGDEMSIRFVAWYNDIDLTVEPIRSGNRVVVVYNLVAVKSRVIPRAPQSADDPIALLVKTWGSDENGNLKGKWFCMQLAREYSQELLDRVNKGSNPEILKRKDAAILRRLRKHPELVILIGEFSATNTYALKVDDCHGRRRIGDLKETELAVVVEDFRIDATPLGFDEKEDESWEEEDCYDYDVLERRYTATVLVAIHRGQLFNSPKYAEFVFDVIKEDEISVEDVRQMLTSSDAKKELRIMNRCVKAHLHKLLTKFGKADLFMTFLDVFMPPPPELINLVAQFNLEWSSLASLKDLKSTLESKIDDFPQFCSEAPSNARGFIISMIPNVVLKMTDLLSKLASEARNCTFLCSSNETKKASALKLALRLLVAVSRFQEPGKPSYCDVLAAVFLKYARTSAQHLLDASIGFLSEIETALKNGDPFAYGALLTAKTDLCLLLQDSAAYHTAKLTRWSANKVWGCTCDLCCQIVAFLLDPSQREIVIPSSILQRTHLRQQLHANNINCKRTDLPNHGAMCKLKLTKTLSEPEENKVANSKQAADLLIQMNKLILDAHRGAVACDCKAEKIEVR